MKLNHWLQNVVDAFGTSTRPQAKRRAKAVIPVSAQMEVLETREVMTASPLVVTTVAVDQVDQTQKAKTQAVANATEVATTKALEFAHVSVTGHNGASKAERTAALQAGYTYTAVTIKNSTNGTINYNFNWNGSSAKSFSLSAGQSRVHYISALNRTATINYDKSFSPGVQNQAYSLSGRNITRPFGFYLVEPTPSVAEGKAYNFKGVPNGVQLYS